MPANRKPTTRAGQIAIRELDVFYDIGCDAIERWNQAPGVNAYGVVKRQAAELGCSISHIHAARRFAEAVTRSELQNYWRLLQNHPGAILLCHLRELATVSNRRQRTELA